MRLGAFSVVESRPAIDGADPNGRYDELLRLIETADRSGLASFWVAEHHFQSSGLCPAPPVLLAAAGQRTSRIRLGSLVCVLPFHRPIDVAEEYSLLDVLLHGRLNFGIGSGYVPLELEGFGVLASAKREAFDRNLAEVRAAFYGEPIQIEGGGCVRINVRSPQVPHPPIWVAAQRRESVAPIARAGLGLALLPYATFRDRSDLGAAVQEYRRALPPGVPGSVSIALPMYVGEDSARAHRALDRHLASRAAASEGFFEGAVRRGPSTLSAAAVARSGFSVFGPSDTVADALEEFERLGVDEVLGMFDIGDLPVPEVVQSIRRAATARARVVGMAPTAWIRPMRAY
ncbi:MAG: LLM class flavin-dependent oxidoreductase [Thermoplasmata archaeon]|jgi:alkanesulfonate monooxygenase SsuD/methylene tetrahydromethanopterin reductase-like flavin-dependent oxidoreductase (luciferase family)|nr:LLM class flavin-dependent oxidoreductase [Thermoplasmata archaeon]